MTDPLEFIRFLVNVWKTFLIRFLVLMAMFFKDFFSTSTLSLVVVVLLLLLFAMGVLRACYGEIQCVTQQKFQTSSTLYNFNVCIPKFIIR